MDPVELKEPVLTDAPPERLSHIEKNLHEFKVQVINEEKELSTKQSNKLKEFISHLHEIKTKIVTSRTECEQKNAQLIAQITSREKKLQGFSMGAKNIDLETGFREKIEAEEKKFISNCQKRIKIADEINYEKMKNLDIEERKSIANQLFKWIIVSIYIEPESKYYWPNFKEQVIENQEALKDLKERLGKISAYNAKEEQRVKTVKFLDAIDKIKACTQFKDFQEDLGKIHQIAKLFLQCCEIGRRVKDYEKHVEQNRKQNSKEDEALVQLRKECDALVEKNKLAELYINHLTVLEKTLTDKLVKYNQQSQNAEKYTEQMNSMTVSKLTAVQPEKRENCECSLY